MNNAAPVEVKVPISFIVMNAIGMLFIGAGIVGLVSPQVLPQLASPRIAWSCIAVGAVMDAFAMAQLFAAIAEAKRRAR